MKHTPLPWFKIGMNTIARPETPGSWEGNVRFICDAHDHCILPTDEDMANAEFIVKACNSHYDLLEALEDCLIAIHAVRALVKGECPWLLNEDSDGSGYIDQQMIETVASAKAAIAKATGEQS
jgi:hypothetical protein